VLLLLLLWAFVTLVVGCQRDADDERVVAVLVVVVVPVVVVVVVVDATAQ
jgi:hypothetical protein